MNINGNVWQKIVNETLRVFPNEMCGILLKDDFVAIENASSTPEKSFIIHPEELVYYIANGNVKAILHSHTNPGTFRQVFDVRTPSFADWQMQKQLNIPFGIVGCEGFTVSQPAWLPRVPSTKYIGREFLWYINDCWTLIEDYFLFEKGIALNLYPQDWNWEEYNTKLPLFEPYLQLPGIEPLSAGLPLQNGDLLLLNFKTGKRNHCGIFHNGDILHQDEISTLTPWGQLCNSIDGAYRINVEYFRSRQV